MPELPEVETVRTGLEMSLKGALLRRVTARRLDLRRKLPEKLNETLSDRRIERIERRAKYLLFFFDSEDVLIMHLGMSGRFLMEPEKPRAYGAHDHLVFELSDGRHLIFNDARRFGLAELTTRNQLEQHSLLANLGPEPLGEAFTASYLAQQLKRRKGPVKPVLMDQKLVVGVGNIYASEALFLAGIRPQHPAANAASKAETLVKSIRAVLEDAITSGGSSLRDFLHINGETGYFQHRFYVYGRAGKPCLKCGTAILMLKQAGRSSFYCPTCQK